MRALNVAALAQSLAPPPAMETLWKKDWHPIFWGLVGLVLALVLVLGVKFAFQALKDHRKERDRDEAERE